MKKVLFYVLTAGFLLYFAYLAFDLVSGRYKVHPEDLYKLEGVTLQSRAFLVRGLRFSGTKCDFRDTAWRSYRIDEDAYRALTNSQAVYDLLQYHGTPLMVHTDSEGFQAFKAGRKGDRIQVYQLSIGGKEYISLKKLNSGLTTTRVTRLLIWLILYGFIWNAYQKAARRKSREEQLATVTGTS